MLNNGYKVRAAAPIFDMDARYAVVGVNETIPNRGSSGGSFTSVPSTKIMVGSTLTRPIQSGDGGLLTLVSPTQLLGANSAGGTASTSVGFNFPWDGVNVTAFIAYGPGWARLTSGTNDGIGPNGDAQDNTQFGSTVTGAFTFGKLIAPWWDIIRTQDTIGYIKTELQGTTPNQVRIIEWFCQTQSSQSWGNYDQFKMQACLYESGLLEYRYGAMSTSATPPVRTAYLATVGARGNTYTAVNQHMWDFFNNSIYDAGNTTILTNLITAGTINDWPGTATNSTGLGTYNIHLVQASGASNGPTKSTSSTGSPCLAHSTSLHRMSVPSYAYGSAMFWIVVNEMGASDVFMCALDVGTAASRRVMLLRHNGVSNRNVSIYGTGGAGTSEKDSTAAYPALISLSGGWDYSLAAAAEKTLYVNNAVPALTVDTSHDNTGNFGTLTATIGGYNDGVGTTGPFNGKICRVLGFNRIPTAAELAALQIQMRLAHWLA